MQREESKEPTRILLIKNNNILDEQQKQDRHQPVEPFSSQSVIEVSIIWSLSAPPCNTLFRFFSFVSNHPFLLPINYRRRPSIISTSVQFRVTERHSDHTGIFVLILTPAMLFSFSSLLPSLYQWNGIALGFWTFEVERRLSPCPSCRSLHPKLFSCAQLTQYLT